MRDLIDGVDALSIEERDPNATAELTGLTFPRHGQVVPGANSHRPPAGPQMSCNPREEESERPDD